IHYQPTFYPVNITDGFAQAFSGGRANRPDLAPGCSNNPRLVNSTVQRYFDTSCFVLPAVGLLGNLGRNTLIGPGFTNLDASLARTTKVSRVSEQFALQFRAEFFNVLKHANFSAPATGLFVLDAKGNGNPIQMYIRNSL